MTRLNVLGAAAIVASAAITPAMAQEVVYNPGYCAQFYPNANCTNKGPDSPYAGGYYARPHVSYQGGNRYADTNASWNTTWNNGYYNNGYYNNGYYGSGFWPADVAAGIVGGAIGTAGAIATAPFRAANAYAWNDGYYGGGYPGTWNQGTWDAGRVKGHAMRRTHGHARHVVARQ
jgi:hypothetical protein